MALSKYVQIQCDRQNVIGSSVKTILFDHFDKKVKLCHS